MSFDLNVSTDTKRFFASKPVVRVPAAKAPDVPAPAKSEPVATPSSAPDVPPTTSARMVMLRHDPERGYFARFFGFPGHNGNELAMRGETLEAVVAYLRERNAKIFDQCWIMIAPRS